MAIVTIGLIVGIISVYLGIGGGPLNIALLVYFFSMKPKTLGSLFDLDTSLRKLSRWALSFVILTTTMSVVILAITFAVLGGLDWNESIRNSRTKPLKNSI